jgi:hypothetical protein
MTIRHMVVHIKGLRFAQSVYQDSCKGWWHASVTGTRQVSKTGIASHRFVHRVPVRKQSSWLRCFWDFLTHRNRMSAQYLDLGLGRVPKVRSSSSHRPIKFSRSTLHNLSTRYSLYITRIPYGNGAYHTEWEACFCYRGDAVPVSPDKKLQLSVQITSYTSVGFLSLQNPAISL